MITKIYGNIFSTKQENQVIFGKQYAPFRPSALEHRGNFENSKGKFNELIKEIGTQKMWKKTSEPGLFSRITGEETIKFSDGDGQLSLIARWQLNKSGLYGIPESHAFFGEDANLLQKSLNTNAISN